MEEGPSTFKAQLLLQDASGATRTGARAKLELRGGADELREALRRKTGMTRFAYGGVEVRTDEDWGRIADGWAATYDTRQRRLLHRAQIKDAKRMSAAA